MLIYILTGTLDSVINANYAALFPEMFRSDESNHPTPGDERQRALPQMRPGRSANVRSVMPKSPYFSETLMCHHNFLSLFENYDFKCASLHRV
jgi:hypothetical protein